MIGDLGKLCNSIQSLGNTTVDDKSHLQLEASRALGKSGLRGIEGTGERLLKHGPGTHGDKSPFQKYMHAHTMTF